MDKKEIEPLFPFGYGFSYTTFDYSDLEISPSAISLDDTLTIKVRIKNIGKRAGDEVIQLYIHDVEASVDREVKSLKGFKRVSLNPNESKTVDFKLDKNALSFYSEKNNKWVAEPGKFKILIGSSSRDIKLTKEFELR